MLTPTSYIYRNLARFQDLCRSLLLELAPFLLGLRSPPAMLPFTGLRNLEERSCCRRLHWYRLVVHGNWPGFGPLLPPPSCRERQTQDTLGSGNDHRQCFHPTHSYNDPKPDRKYSHTDERIFPMYPSVYWLVMLIFLTRHTPIFPRHRHGSKSTKYTRRSR